MQAKRTTNDCKRVDSYSALICSKYFRTGDDFVNLICVNSKFKETTEKLRFNPIPIKSLKLFPKIQTQYLYSKDDTKITSKQIEMYEIWYIIDYEEYTRYENRNNVKCHSVEYTEKNRITYWDEIPNGVTLIGDFGFSECSTISTINLPSPLKSLGNYCFYGCRTLSTVNLPSSLTSLGDGCFRECRTLSTIILPSSLSSLGKSCFHGCYRLKGVINVPHY
ncbi:Leucine rich repeat containing protein BspA family protein [Entamoeba marina]